jgi:hypothetical protein
MLSKRMQYWDIEVLHNIMNLEDERESSRGQLEVMIL